MDESISIPLTEEQLQWIQAQARKKNLPWKTFLKRRIYAWLGLNDRAIRPGTIVVGPPSSFKEPTPKVPPPAVIPYGEKAYLRSKPVLPDKFEEGASVYILQAISVDGFIKIGFSSSPLQRLIDLQTSNPYELKLRVILQPGTLALEQYLHNRFKKDHVKGEWFLPSKELMSFIEEKLLEAET